MRKGIGLTNKVILAFILLIILPIVTIGALFFNNSRAVMEQQLMQANLKNLENINDYYVAPLTERINVFLNAWAAEPGLDEILSRPATKTKYESRLAESIKAVPDIDTIYIGDKNGKMFTVPYDPLPSDYDPRTRPWYKSAIAMDGSTIWTEPYLDAGTKGMVLSVAKQVNDPKGELYGVLAVDLKLNKMVEIIKGIKLGKDGYVVLLDSAGKAIAIPDEKLVGKDISSLDWVKKAYSERRGSTFFKIKNEEVVLSYLSDDKTGWKLIAIMPKEEMIKEFSGVDNSMRKMMSLLAIWGAIACIGLVVYFRKLLFTPMKTIMELMKRAADGDLNFKFDQHYKDEIGQLYRAFENMVHGQKVIISQVHDTADELNVTSEKAGVIAGYTTQTTHSQSFAMEELTKAIEDMSISVNDVTMNINEIAGNIKGVAISMQDMGVTANEVARSTVATSEAMGDVMRSLTELEASTNLISINTSCANAQGEKSVEIVGEGKRIIDNTIVEMENISKTMQELTWVINDLGKAATQIGDIIEVIDDISEQTNLLSLNASIEAARAGEHGKGFAVVASAIGRLSEKSSESTKDIEKLIKQIQGIVEEAVKTTTKSAARIENGVALVTETEAAFSNIHQAIEETTDLINQIALSTHEQTEASKIIMDATIKVNELTMHVSAASQEQLATVEEIIQSTEVVNELTQDVASCAQVQAANSQEIAATALTVNEMTTDVRSKSEEVRSMADELGSQAKSLMEVVTRFRV